MPRPIWNGSISFGLVNVPIKMFNAVQKKALHFHQLRQSDGCRIQLKRICRTDQKEVATTDIVKGYEISPDRYVIVDKEDLEALQPKANRSIEIEDFVLLSQIDPIYFSQSYYLVPDKGAAKAYSLLQEAMQQTKKVAISRLVLRSKQYLAAIRPNHGVLTLSTMFFADEIIAQDQLDGLPDTTAKPNERELAIAMQLIDSLSADFQPQKYHDDYQNKVLAMIENKSEGQNVILQQPANAQGGKVIDLMAALEASLSAIKKKAPAKNGRRKSRAQ